MRDPKTPGWKRLLHNAYYFGTLPLRWNNLRRWRRTGRAPLMVLFYHRIADQYPNDWSMSNTCFEAQVDWLQANFDLISIEELQRRMQTGENPSPAVSVTFDDGYAENCEAALPLLIKRRIPCTYFVSLDFVRSGRPFPHDEALGQPLQPNTVEQLRAMAQAGVEIGCHTRTHCDLGPIVDDATLWDEVVTARDELAALIDHPVRYFAFPFGMPDNLNARVFQMAYDTGFEAVCSAYGGYNFPRR